MNRRTARLLMQVFTVAVLASLVLDDGMPLWFLLVWLVALGITVAELGVVLRFGQGNLWRDA